MSEDLVAIIEELIRTERGDVGRLQDILAAIKNGEPVSFEDHHYVENLAPNKPTPDPSTDDIIDTKPDNTFESKVPEPIPQASEEESAKRSPAKKYATVGIIVAIVLVAYIGLDVYAINNLQFRPHHGQQVVISDTQLGIRSDACNPSYFPATFTKYEIIATYNSDEIEKATIGGFTLSPKSAAVLDGVFSINKDAATKIAKENTPFDPSKATITTSVYAPIFGVVPYTVNKKYDAQDFQNRIKNPPPGTFDCYP
jgi:hypothetical protein